MFEKNLHIAYLLDFYGEVLGERTRELLEMYYCDDMSLSEIADAVGITRQGARGGIKKGEEELLFLEEKLGLAVRHRILTEHAERLSALVGALRAGREDVTLDRLLSEALRCTDAILEKNKED